MCLSENESIRYVCVRMGIVFVLSEKGSNLCVNQHLPVGGGCSWSIPLTIQIDNE